MTPDELLERLSERRSDLILEIETRKIKLEECERTIQEIRAGMASVGDTLAPRREGRGRRPAVNPVGPSVRNEVLGVIRDAPAPLIYREIVTALAAKGFTFEETAVSAALNRLKKARKAPMLNHVDHRYSIKETDP